VKKLLQISLGIIAAVGGFLETGSIATSAQAGVAFGFQLIWDIVLGTICLIFLVEMSGAVRHSQPSHSGRWRDNCRLGHSANIRRMAGDAGGSAKSARGPPFWLTIA
jgi:hypothetical protein